MRVLHISKYDLKGGASRAAYSSVLGQRRATVDAEMLVGRKQGRSAFVRAPKGIMQLATLAAFAGEKSTRLVSRNRYNVRSLHLFGVSADWVERSFRPDIVIAHKVDGILALSQLAKFSVPVIWRLHDMWPVCGTRHYAPEDEVLKQPPSEWSGSRFDRLIEGWIYHHKKRTYRRARNLSFCTPSQWLADCLRASPLIDGAHRVDVVPNGIDTSAFEPLCRDSARKRLGLPPDKPVILFGAADGLNDRRKGFDLLVNALSRLDAPKHCRPVLLLFGNTLPSELAALDLPVVSAGSITDDRKLSTVYSAADVFVAPSRQENLSLTVLESLACSTPVVAFRIGGMPDMIRHAENGWLARPFDTGELAHHISAAIQLTGAERESLRRHAREGIIEHFSMEVEAQRMCCLYHEVINRSKCFDRTLHHNG